MTEIKSCVQCAYSSDDWTLLLATGGRPFTQSTHTWMYHCIHTSWLSEDTIKLHCKL